MKQELNVVAALLEYRGKLLLCQRKHDDKYGDLWEFPGGTIEEGESQGQALVREIKEELDITIEVGRLINVFEDEDSSLKITVFLFACSGLPTSMREKDCQAFGFFDFTEMKTLRLAPVDIKIAEYLRKNHTF